MHLYQLALGIFAFCRALHVGRDRESFPGSTELVRTRLRLSA
jgi:hypothetical protein